MRLEREMKVMNSLKGELEYGSISLDGKEDYRLYRYSDAGMGETEYRIFRNGAFFAMFDNRKDAEEVMTVMTHKSERETFHFSSSDLLLIAHDEWKRREERKHIHEHISWVTGWISGFLTSRKFVQEKVAELRQAGKL